MDGQEKKRLVEKRKFQPKEKEFTNNIARYLKVEDQNNGLKTIGEKNENRYVEGSLLFFGTLLPPLYFHFCTNLDDHLFVWKSSKPSRY